MSQGEEFLQHFVNHEKTGVPAGAGKDDKGGFDMVRIHNVQLPCKHFHTLYELLTYINGTQW